MGLAAFNRMRELEALKAKELENKLKETEDENIIVDEEQEETPEENVEMLEEEKQEEQPEEEQQNTQEEISANEIKEPVRRKNRKA